jgi:cell division septum initiation protein DivIVA
VSELEALREENERLRARVAELDRQLGEQAAAANAAIAAAQDRAYWLDRARIDLNAVMRTPAGRALLAVVPALRGPVRRLRGRA